VENPALNTQLARVDFEKGRQKFVSGDNKGAIDALSAYLSAYPNGADVREASIYRARAYANGGKSAAALKDYEAVYSQNTVDRWTLTASSEAAEILQGNKNYLGALKLYQNIDKIAEKSATKADARFGMAACYRALQQYKQVEIALAPVTEDKNLPESVRNRAKTESGVAAYRQNRIDLALQLFTEVEDEGDGEPAAESQYWRVRIFADQKRYKEAKAGAVYLANNYPTFNYWKAKAYLVMAEADVALEEKFQAKATLESLAGESRYPDVQQEAKDKLAALNL
jgi:TolA-binding protein